MLTDILLQKLVVNPAVGWQKTIIPVKHARLRSNTANRIIAHQGYLPLVRYSVSDVPLTLSAGNALQALVAKASGRPILVLDPLDFKASISPTHDGHGGWAMGALKFLGGRQLVGPTPIKLYGVEGARNIEGGSSRHRVMMRPITFIEDGIADNLGTQLPFTLDAITREVLLDGLPMAAPPDFYGTAFYIQQIADGPSDYLGAEFKFWTPMEFTEFTLKPASGASVQQTLISGYSEQCIAYYMNATLTEVIPVFDPVLQFETLESVVPGIGVGD